MAVSTDQSLEPPKLDSRFKAFRLDRTCITPPQHPPSPLVMPFTALTGNRLKLPPNLSPATALEAKLQTYVALLGRPKVESTHPLAAIINKESRLTLEDYQTALAILKFQTPYTKFHAIP